MRTAVLGAGSWGTTLAIVLAENGHAVSLWDHDAERAAVVARLRETPAFLPGVHIPDGVVVTGQLDAVVRGAGLVTFVVPTHVMRTTARAVRDCGALTDDAIIVCASKGLEEKTLARMSDVLREELSVDARRIVTLAGPGHAEEVSRQVPTSIVAAGRSRESCEAVQDAFVRPYLRIYTNEDITGVELATAFKNSIAIAAGILDGLGCGDNTKAALITRGLAEITRLGVAMGPPARPFRVLQGWATSWLPV